jgi:hypothetical protein
LALHAWRPTYTSNSTAAARTAATCLLGVLFWAVLWPPPLVATDIAGVVEAARCMYVYGSCERRRRHGARNCDNSDTSCLKTLSSQQVALSKTGGDHRPRSLFMHSNSKAFSGRSVNCADRPIKLLRFPIINLSICVWLEYRYLRTPPLNISQLSQHLSRLSEPSTALPVSPSPSRHLAAYQCRPG